MEIKLNLPKELKIYQFLGMKISILFQIKKIKCMLRLFLQNRKLKI